MIRLIDVHKTLGERPILRGLDLRVKEGEVLVIVGRSGTGKSVTLKHAVGLLLPDRGRVEVMGTDLARSTPAELDRVRAEMGMVFQSGALVNWLSVEDNVALPLRETLRLPESEVRERVEAGLARVHLEGQGGKFPSEISGGMKKRVGIARALVTEPKILLYDEPTSGLDPVTAKSMDDLILETRKTTHATSVVVSHDLMSTFRIADRIAMLHEGTAIAVGTPDEIRKSDQPQVQEFLATGLHK